jgi:hypothetical protein
MAVLSMPRPKQIINHSGVSTDLTISLSQRRPAVAKKQTASKSSAATSSPTFLLLNVGAQPTGVAIPSGASIQFSLSITDNKSSVSTNGKIFLEGAGPHSTPVLPQDVVVTPGSPAQLSLPQGSYVYWFIAQGHGDFTLNEEGAKGEHGVWRAYKAPGADWFHFSVHA